MKWVADHMVSVFWITDDLRSDLSWGRRGEKRKRDGGWRRGGGLWQHCSSNIHANKTSWAKLKRGGEERERWAEEWMRDGWKERVQGERERSTREQYFLLYTVCIRTERSLSMPKETNKSLTHSQTKTKLNIHLKKNWHNMSQPEEKHVGLDWEIQHVTPLFWMWSLLFYRLHHIYLHLFIYFSSFYVFYYLTGLFSTHVICCFVN